MNETQTLGEMPLAEAIEELRKLGNEERVRELEAILADADTTVSPGTPLYLVMSARPYEHVGVGVGYVADDAVSPYPLQSARLQTPDDTLKNKQINVKLDGFVTANYPMSGTSEVLFECSGRHHIVTQGADQPVAFTRKFTVRDRGAAGVIGLPLFMGLMVPPGGIGLEFKVVYVKNRDAHRFLDFLNSPPMQGGLSLLTTANPVIAPFAELAQGIVGYVAKRNDGREIHRGYVGLDFSGRFGAKMNLGTYVVAQIPGLEIEWSDWQFKEGGIQKTTDGSPFPYNYYLIRVEQYEAPPPPV